MPDRHTDITPHTRKHLTQTDVITSFEKSAATPAKVNRRRFFQLGAGALAAVGLGSLETVYDLH